MCIWCILYVCIVKDIPPDTRALLDASEPTTKDELDSFLKDVQRVPNLSRTTVDDHDLKKLKETAQAENFQWGCPQRTAFQNLRKQICLSCLPFTEYFVAAWGRMQYLSENSIGSPTQSRRITCYVFTYETLLNITWQILLGQRSQPRRVVTPLVSRYRYIKRSKDDTAANHRVMYTVPPNSTRQLQRILQSVAEGYKRLGEFGLSGFPLRYVYGRVHS